MKGGKKENAVFKIPKLLWLLITFLREQYKNGSETEVEDISTSTKDEPRYLLDAEGVVFYPDENDKFAWG